MGNEKEKGRGKDPSERTKFLLFAKVAGRCQFCNKDLLLEDFTYTICNNSNIDHIVAYSPNGPRGNEHSYELSDKIDNLMLLCKEHHKLIDDHPEIYTTELLKEMKQNQEKKVNELCKNMDIPLTEIVRLQSPIKGIKEVKISYKQTVEAFLLKKRPMNENGILIECKSNFDYHDKKYWEDVNLSLENDFNIYIKMRLKDNPTINFSIFPIAPIPLIIKLGYLFGDKIITNIYQKTRCPDTWSWQKDEQTNSFTTRVIKNGPGNNFALVIGLTAHINLNRITTIGNFDQIYIIEGNEEGVDCISSEKDLSKFWHTYLTVCDSIKNSDNQPSEISLFPAVPVSAAFEIGKRYMQGIYPKIKIYDDDNGFFETISIGEE